jgi:hypothetical protein
MASPENPTTSTSEPFQSADDSPSLERPDTSATYDDCIKWVNWPSDTEPEVATVKMSDKHKSIETVDENEVPDSPASPPQNIESKDKCIRASRRSISSNLARCEDSPRKPRGRPRKLAADPPEPTSVRKRARRGTATSILEARLQTPNTTRETVPPRVELQKSMPGVHQPIDGLPGGGDSGSPEEARFDLENGVFMALEGGTPLEDPSIVNNILQILADLAPLTVTLINSLTHTAPDLSQSIPLDPTHAMYTKPIILMPIYTAEPEASWLLAVLDSEYVRVVDPLPAENHIGVVTDRMKMLISDQPTLLKSTYNEACVPGATNTNTGISVVIHAIHAITESCGTEMDMSSPAELSFWRPVMLRILKAA